MSTIGVVLPAYNEASVIGDVLEELPRTLDINGNHYDLVIIVVNDGSRDDTEAIARSHAGVTVIGHILNSGAGAATRTGLHYARSIGCEYAATIDADGQHAVGDLIRVITALMDDSADFVIGSRLLDSKGMPRHRVIGNKGLGFITYLLFGVFVTDSQSGLRALNKRALADIDYRSDHYAFCSEMIWRAKGLGFRIKEVPIKAIYTDYSLGKGQSNWGAFNIIGQLLKRRIMELTNE